MYLESSKYDRSGVVKIYRTTYLLSLSHLTKHGPDKKSIPLRRVDE